MAQAASFEKQLRDFCYALVNTRTNYPWGSRPAISEQLFVFLQGNPYYKATAEPVLHKMENATYHVIVLRGTVATAKTPEIQVTIQLMINFPTQAPIVLVACNLPGIVPDRKPYMNNDMAQNPAIKNWNQMTSNLRAAFKELTDLLQMDPPFKPSAAPVSAIPEPNQLMYPYQQPPPMSSVPVNNIPGYGAGPRYPPGPPYGMAPAAPPKPIAPGMDLSAERDEKERLKDAVLTKVKEKFEDYQKEVKVELEEIEKHAPIIQVNEGLLKEKKEELEKKKIAINSSIGDLQKITNQLKKMGATKEITPDNVLTFIKGANDLHERALSLDQKKLALEECVMQLKKGYEEKAISLQELLECSRKMFDKQFKCLYKKWKLNQVKLQREVKGQMGK